MALLRNYNPQHASFPWGSEFVYGFIAGQHSLDGVYRCLRPILPECFSAPARIFSRPRRGGANPNNLRPLCRETQLEKVTSQLKIALINARSLVNKTFILNDFFTSQALDFLCVTETWSKPGELFPFSELVPYGCNFLNSPRMSGRGGGLATVFKDTFHCRSLSTGPYNSFEVQLLQLVLVNPITIALIYRPPHHNKDFLSELAALMGDLVTRHEKVLLLGDFNIHVCCSSKPYSAEFLNLIESFDFTQWVSSPTHNHGHTLDLILTHGFSISNIEISSASFSDHRPVFCTIPLMGRVLRNPSLARLTRSLTQHSSEEFSVAYRDVCNSLESESTLLNLDADAHFNLFNSTCADIMNSIAPLKYKNHKPLPVPWHTETTRTLRRTCRQAERKWKKDRLQVSNEVLRNSYNMFQKAAKAAKCKYLSELITNNCHKPQVLFSTINSVLNPSVHPILEPSTSLCNNFGQFFVEKITILRSQLFNSTYILHDVPLCSSTWSEFEPIDLISCNEIVGHLKPTICPQDIIPPLFLRQIMDTVGSGLLLVINKCLSTGSFPNSLKCAVVTPYLKKPNLDPSSFSNFRPISNLPFISKILEKIVLTQLQSYLTANSVHEMFQSGFKALHSTESALLRVSSDILLKLTLGNPWLWFC